MLITSFFLEFCYNKDGDIMAKKKKKKLIKIKKTPFILLIVLLLIIGLFIHFNSKTYLFYKAYNKSISLKLEIYKEFKNKYYPYIDNKYLLETNTVFNYNENKNKINGKIYIDDSDNYFDLDIKQNEEEQKITIINKDNKTYYKYNDSFYYINNPSSQSLSDKEISTIISKYFKKYIRNGSISKKKETIKYDKEYKTTKLTLKLSNRDLYNYLLDVLRDKKIKKGVNTKDFIKKIEDKKKKEKYIKDYFEYSIYLYKGEPILEKYEFENHKNIISVFKNKNYKHIIFKLDGSKKDSYIIINNNKVDLFFDGYFYGKGNITDKGFEIVFTDYNKKEIGSILYDIEKEKNIYDISFKMYTNLDSLKLNIEINNKIDNSKSIPSIDLDNAKSINELSEKDIELFRSLLTN